MKHPNAAAAATTGGLATFVVWLLGHFHVDLSAEDGAVIAGAVASVVLYIGRNGIKGMWRRIWDGQDGASIIELLIVAIVVAIVVLFVKVY